MDAPRKRLYLAVGLFALWVAALATVAAVSSRKPPEFRSTTKHAG